MLGFHTIAGAPIAGDSGSVDASSLLIGAVSSTSPGALLGHGAGVGLLAGVETTLFVGAQVGVGTALSALTGESVHRKSDF